MKFYELLILTVNNAARGCMHCFFVMITILVIVFVMPWWISVCAIIIPQDSNVTLCEVVALFTNNILLLQILVVQCGRQIDLLQFYWLQL